jgi:hypothetical protein
MLLDIKQMNKLLTLFMCPDMIYYCSMADSKFGISSPNEYICFKYKPGDNIYSECFDFKMILLQTRENCTIQLGLKVFK